MNSIYSVLSRIRPLAKSYTSKFLFVAFLGIHIPLIGLIFFLSFNAEDLGRMPIFLITLALTLVATATTLFVLRALLAPMNAAKNALGNYLSRREIPNLPSGFKDEAGVLMRQVQETIQMLDALQDEQKDIIGFLSRDLRAPLSTIMSLSRQLELEPGMEAALRRKLSTMIADSANDQVGRFKQMLSLLRTEGITRNHLGIERIAPSALMHAVVDEMQPIASRKDVVIELQCPALPGVSGDARLLSEALKNVLSNAIRFSRNGGKVVMQASAGNDLVRVDIRDEGPGFEPAQAEQLFERFGGMSHSGGIGLFLARKILAAHDGRISAASPGSGHGAVFSIEIPAATH